MDLEIGKSSNRYSNGSLSVGEGIGWEAGIRNHSRRARSARRDASRETCRPGKTNEPKAREFWLGGRDSNPDTVVQSHVSYRWTTSQCQSRRLSGQELSIIAAGLTLGKPTYDRQFH